MKTTKHLIIFIYLAVSSTFLFSQGGTSVTGGTMTVYGSESGGNFDQRDEVIVSPPNNSTEINITTGSGIDAHLYTDPNTILPASYVTPAQIANQTFDNSLPVGTLKGANQVTLDGNAVYSVPIF